MATRRDGEKKIIQNDQDGQDPAGSPEEIRRSLDVLDRVLSEFDDDDDDVEEVDPQEEEGGGGPWGPPPPVDRTLKPPPRGGPALPPRERRRRRKGGGHDRPPHGALGPPPVGVDPQDHEYQEIGPSSGDFSGPGGPPEDFSVPGGPLKDFLGPGGPPEDFLVPGGPLKDFSVPGGPLRDFSTPGDPPEDLGGPPSGRRRRRRKGGGGVEGEDSPPEDPPRGAPRRRRRRSRSIEVDPRFPHLLLPPPPPQLDPVWGAPLPPPFPQDIPLYPFDPPQLLLGLEGPRDYYYYYYYHHHQDLLGGDYPLPPPPLPLDYPPPLPLDYPPPPPLECCYPLPMDYPPPLPQEAGGRPWGLREDLWPPRRPPPPPPPPPPGEATRALNAAVRKPNRCEELRDAVDSCRKKPHSGKRRSSRRLTSAGHSDSSGLSSSPTEEGRPLNRMQSSYSSSHQAFRETPSEFRVGEAVREASPRGLMKGSTSLPHFPSGKDSGFDETPLVGEDGSNSGGRGGRTGGAFIVSGVFNDSSRMFIPAPPSPTPDYDDDGDSDGNESDILQGSQFYVVSDSKGDAEKRVLANRDSLSDDSLQNAPVMAKPSKAPVQKPTTPLQNMMKEFHQGLPLVENENGFSDDSLEDSTIGPSRPPTADQKPRREDSMESLISVESSTASFDYLNAGQAKTSSYEGTKSKPSPTTPATGNIGGHKDRKDINGKVKKSLPKEAENGSSQKAVPEKEGENVQGDVGGFSRQSSRESSQSSGSTCSKPGEKFDTIRYMLKEGLIEGLDESPPQFKPPPPPPIKTHDGIQSEERTDGRLGSALGLTRLDEGGGSDDRLDLAGTPPSLPSPRGAENASRAKSDSRKGKDTVRSRSSIASEDMERNRDEGDEVEIQVKETLEMPPTPPPRDESMHWTPRTTTPAVQKDRSRLSGRSVPTTPSTSKNSSWLHDSTSGKDEMTEVASDHFQHCSGDKITHVDDLYGQNEQLESGSEVSSAINGSLASQYSAQDNDNPLTDLEFLENLKNLEPRPRPDTLAVITEDQGSIGSRGSRSGRLLSRLAESVRSGSRTPTPSSTSSSTTRATTTKLTSTSRASTRIHGDIIRETWRSSLRESALPSPQEYAHLPSLSPSVVPLTRDGSGRFRSIEDLAEAISAPAEDTTLSGKKKKHSTLPPNLTPGDMKKENKELRRATSLMVGKKIKEGGSSEGPKFRLDFFFFWRRRKRRRYSFGGGGGGEA